MKNLNPIYLLLVFIFIVISSCSKEEFEPLVSESISQVTEPTPSVKSMVVGYYQEEELNNVYEIVNDVTEDHGFMGKINYWGDYDYFLINVPNGCSVWLRMSYGSDQYITGTLYNHLNQKIGDYKLGQSTPMLTSGFYYFRLSGYQNVSYRVSMLWACKQIPG